MKKIFLKFVCGLLLFLLLLEVALRAMPKLIPLDVLGHYQDDLRKTIAKRIDLPTSDDALTRERDDSGPTLYLWKPLSVVTRTFGDVGSVDVVRMDEIGFSNPLESYKKKQIDFLAIGDSFTWATNVHPQDTWPHQFAKLSGVSSYNLGKDGTGMYSQIQILKIFGLKKDPKMVVLNYYLGNDIRDGLRFHEYRQKVKETGTYSSSPRLHNLYKMIKNNLFIKESYSLNFALSCGAEAFNFFNKEEDEEKEEVYYYHAATSDQRVTYTTEGDEVFYATKMSEKGIDLDSIFSEGLENFIKLSGEHSFVPIIMLSPSAYSAYDPIVEFDDPKIGKMLKNYSRAQRDFFQKKADELGFYLLDLVPYLHQIVQAKESKLTHYPKNLHYTTWGHQKVGEILYEFVLNEGILKSLK